MDYLEMTGRTEILNKRLDMLRCAPIPLRSLPSSSPPSPND